MRVFIHFIIITHSIVEFAVQSHLQKTIQVVLQLSLWKHTSVFNSTKVNTNMCTQSVEDKVLTWSWLPWQQKSHISSDMASNDCSRCSTHENRLPSNCCNIPSCWKPARLVPAHLLRPGAKLASPSPHFSSPFSSSLCGCKWGKPMFI